MAGAGEDTYEPFGDDVLLTVHVVLGATVPLLGAARLVRRPARPLPPWAPTLTAVERRLAHGTETTLHAATSAVPVTGVALVLPGADLLVLHITAQAVLHAALTAHVVPGLRHQLIGREHLLSHMLCRGPTTVAGWVVGRPDREHGQCCPSSTSRRTPALSSFPEAFLGTVGTIVRRSGSL
ncbi:hypothetical protein [Streptomyces europaeiscabiei]|uniref:hypothetical protein n=1 Tax=Streptomyces europaeiscabiei TaxID=146819 RepID=UPI0038F64602